MKLEFDETETNGVPFVLTGAIENILAIVSKHDGRLWFGIVGKVIEELMAKSYDDPRFVIRHLKDSVEQGVARAYAPELELEAED